MQLKRLWDITNKKMVFVKGPTGHDCQLWVDEATEKMYYYDMSQWLEYTQSSEDNGRTYGPTWKVVDGDDEMGVYDTDKPTDLFVWESGDKVSYVFKNYDGTVLKEGKVNEGTAPTPPADPTKPSTAAETFTFTGWNPTVAPITKKTTYTAQYEASPRDYTVTIGVSPEGAGTVGTSQVTVPYGSPIGSYNNELFVADYTIVATAGSGYEFSSWGTLPATVTGDLTVTATFEAIEYECSIISQDDTMGTVSCSDPDFDGYKPYGTTWTVNSNVITLSDGTTFTATPESGYTFTGWYDTDYNAMPASGTITGDIDYRAIFDSPL